MTGSDEKQNVEWHKMTPKVPWGCSGCETFRRSGGVAFLLWIAVLCSACAGRPQTAGVNPAASENRKTVAVLPLRDMADIYGPDAYVRSPVSDKMFKTGPLQAEAASFLTELLDNLLQKRSDAAYLSVELGTAALQALPDDVFNRHSELEPMLAAGRALSADAVITGYVYRFRERIGHALSVDSPASVAFEVALVDVLKERVLWYAHFDETQRSLSENVLQWRTFWKRGGVWITAHDMAASAMTTLLEKMPVR